MESLLGCARAVVSFGVMLVLGSAYSLRALIGQTLTTATSIPTTSACVVRVQVARQHRVEARLRGCQGLRIFLPIGRTNPLQRWCSMELRIPSLHAPAPQAAL